LFGESAGLSVFRATSFLGVWSRIGPKASHAGANVSYYVESSELQRCAWGRRWGGAGAAAPPPPLAPLLPGATSATSVGWDRTLTHEPHHHHHHLL